MATTLFYLDTASSLTISGYTVKLMGTARGSGVVTKTDNSSAASSIAVTDATVPLAFGYQVNGYSATTGTYSFNHWGSESNAMANFGAGADEIAGGAGGVVIYDSGGTLRFQIAVTSGPSAEYGTSAGAMTFTKAGTARTVNGGDWIVVFPSHETVGSPAGGFTLNFSYNGTSAAANGDSFITLPDTVSAFTAAANPPYVNPMPPLIAQ